MFRKSKLLFMHIFLQINQSLRHKYSQTVHFRKQLTGKLRDSSFLLHVNEKRSKIALTP
jgi:hypothetical protein